MKLPKVKISFPKWWNDYVEDIIETSAQIRKCGVDDEIVEKFVNDSIKLIAKEAVEFNIVEENKNVE